MRLWVFLKSNPSKCNKKLISFLKSKMKKIKKNHQLRVVIIYEDLYDKLPPDITNLPVLITEKGKMVVGNSQIMKNLNRTTDKSSTSDYIPPSDNINDFWAQQMYSKEQETEADEPADLMESVRQRALTRSMTHKEKINKTKRKADPVGPDTQEDRDRLGSMQSENISDFTDDPMAKKFWENQEATPGFNV